MDTSKNEVVQHIKSAKQWLEKAENSFERHSGAKGRLNLFLAEAEMQQLREKQQRSAEYVWLQQLGAVVVAIVIGIGVLYMWPTMIETPSVVHGGGSSAWIAAMPAKQEPWLGTTTKLTVTSLANPIAAAVEAQTVPQQNEEIRQNEKIVATSPVESNKEPHVSAQTVVLSQTEMQQVVRDANRSLRGK